MENSYAMFQIKLFKFSSLFVMISKLIIFMIHLETATGGDP